MAKRKKKNFPVSKASGPEEKTMIRPPEVSGPKEQKKGPQTDVKQARKPWTKAIFLTATASALGLAALGIVKLHRDSKTNQPNISGTFSSRIDRASQDQRHGISDPFAQIGMQMYRKRGVKMAIPNGQSCIACHHVEDLPDTLAKRLKEKEARLMGLLPPEAVHFRLENGFIAYPPSPISYVGTDQKHSDLSHILASNMPWGIQFRLQAEADPLLREHMESHELTHYMSQVPGDYLPETFAYAATALTTPLSVLQTADDQISAPKYVAILHRAALYRRGRSDPLPPAVEAAQAHQTLNHLDETEVNADVRAFSPVYKEAMGEYRKNTLFWDTAAYQYQNPYLLFDAILARRLFEQGHEPLRQTLNDPAKLEQVQMQLKETGELRRRDWEGENRHLPAAEAHEKNVFSFDELNGDIRNGISMQVAKNRSQDQLDGEYFSGIYSLFGKKGGFRYDAMTSDEMERHARLKVQMIQRSLNELNDARQMLKTQVQARPEDKRTMAGRMDAYEKLHQTTANGLKEMLRTRTFIRK